MCCIKSYSSVAKIKIPTLVIGSEVSVLLKHDAASPGSQFRTYRRKKLLASSVVRLGLRRMSYKTGKGTFVAFFSEPKTYKDEGRTCLPKFVTDSPIRTPHVPL